MAFAVQKWLRPPKHGAIGLWGAIGHVRHRKKSHCHKALSKKVISNSGFSLIDFCQKNCNSMSMAHALADHVFFISTNQMQPRCQSCVEFNGGFRGWHPFLLILKTTGLHLDRSMVVFCPVFGGHFGENPVHWSKSKTFFIAPNPPKPQRKCDWCNKKKAHPSGQN